MWNAKAGTAADPSLDGENKEEDEIAFAFVSRCRTKCSFILWLYLVRGCVFESATGFCLYNDMRNA